MDRKFKYRLHPDLGFYQSTIVTTKEADADLALDGWCDEKPEGFIEGSIHGDENAPITEATIAMIVPGDILN